MWMMKRPASIPGLNQKSPISWSRQPVLMSNALLIVVVVVVAAAGGTVAVQTSFQKNVLLVALELMLIHAHQNALVAAAAAALGLVLIFAHLNDAYCYQAQSF